MDSAISRYILNFQAMLIQTHNKSVVDSERPLSLALNLLI